MGRAEKLDHKKHGKDFSFSYEKIQKQHRSIYNKGESRQTLFSPLKTFGLATLNTEPIMTTFSTKQKHGGREKPVIICEAVEG